MDQRAVTAPVAMSIAMALFLSLFATIALTARDVGDGDAAEASDAATLRAQAGSLLDVMIQSPGYSGGGVDWIGNEDDLVRLGLREAGTNQLSFEKFENLRQAPYGANATDGFINYEEARQALGYDDAGLGFHIRAKPSLKAVEDILKNGERDPNMKVTYLADSTSAADNDTLTAPLITSNPSCTLDGSGKTYTIEATVQNLGVSTTQLSAYITFDPPSGGKRTEWAYGPKALPLQNTTLSTTVPVYGGYCDAGAKITFEIWDPSQQWSESTTTLTVDVGGTVHANDLVLDASKSYYIDEDVAIAYDGAGLKNNDELTFGILDGLGASVAGPITFPAGSNNDRSVVVGDVTPGTRAIDLGGPLGVGTYTAYLDDGTVNVTDQVHVFASWSEPGDYVAPEGVGSSSLTDAAVAETDFLNDLVEQFCPFTYDGTAVMDPSPAHADRCNFGGFQSGDVIPDQKREMDDELPKRLLDGGAPTYEHVSTLVVGSNVDHKAMTSAAAKHAVRDWVLGGGTLIVFGSSEQTVQWLQPIFHSGIDPSGGGIGTPDADHPLLQVSDTLDYDRYDNQGRVWELQENGEQSSADKFTNVVQDDNEEAILAISDPGAYGDGTIILTAWLPYDLFGDGSDPGREGLKLINNLLLQSYRGLFLDYGPPLPDGQAVVPATGKAQIYHPELDLLVSLDMTLFVFEQG